jgi:hypothetical protein
MRRVLPILVLLFLIPASSHAQPAPATFSIAQTLLSASSSPGNLYAAGASVVVAAPVDGDLSAFGGSVITAAQVQGDELLFGGSIRSRARVGGDVRIVGGSITVEEPVSGDIVALGLTVHDSGHAGGSVFIVAANTTISDGADGPVTIYGNNISLGGNYGGDVTVVASGRVSLLASTTIAGSLSYQSPEDALIPASARIRGGVTYTNASYLPDVGTSRILSLISIGFFLFVRVLGALILAGILAGLFPRLADMLLERTTTMRPSRILLTTLLGFAVFVVTPILTLLLALTFVGIGIALLFFVGYALIILLAILYAGILIGGLLAKRFMHREGILWRDGVLGMLVFSLLTLIPYIGTLAIALLTAYTLGALSLLFFHFAFPHEEETPELL